MNLPNSFTAKADRVPPCVGRIFARGADGHLATDTELMHLTGWGRSRLISVYRRRSFAGVKTADVDKFYEACGLRWSSQRRIRWKLQEAFERGGVDAVARFHHLRPRNATEASQLKAHLRRIKKLMSA